jgi:hypothetical protein
MRLSQSYDLGCEFDRLTRVVSKFFLVFLLNRFSLTLSWWEIRLHKFFQFAFFKAILGLLMSFLLVF